MGVAVARSNEVVAEAVEIRAQRRRGHVRVFASWCKGCGLCIAFCPQGVFVEGREHRPIVAHLDKCVACHWCDIHCPDFAILVEELGGRVREVGK